jgi:hypothetical protein
VTPAWRDATVQAAIPPATAQSTHSKIVTDIQTLRCDARPKKKHGAKACETSRINRSSDESSALVKKSGGDFEHSITRFPQSTLRAFPERDPERSVDAK